MSDDIIKSPPQQVTLSCLHDATYMAPVPTPGSSAYCRVCREYRTVRTEDEVWVRCGHCTLAKRHGQDVAGAMRAASKHAMKRPTHLVTVYKGREQLQQVRGDGEQGELPYERLLADRRAMNAENHKLLYND